jgi:hypothetical protein
MIPPTPHLSIKNCCPDPSGAEAPARKEHRALRPEAGERSAVHGRGVPAGEAVRLRVRAHHWREEFPPIRRRHACLPRSLRTRTHAPPRTLTSTNTTHENESDPTQIPHFL